MIHHATSTMPDQGGAGAMLKAVLALFERHRVPYCVPHGYADYPAWSGHDVDLIVDPSISARDLQLMVHEAAPAFGARLVRCRGRHLMLSRREADGGHTILTLDIDRASEFGGVTFFTAGEMLRGREVRPGFWVPAPEMEFGHSLARWLARGGLDGHRARCLQRLFAGAPEGCRAILTRLLVPQDRDAVGEALQTGDWQAVLSEQKAIRSRLLRRAVIRHPLSVVAAAAQRLGSRLARLIRPDGVALVALGPDGAGKSSTTDALGGPALLPVFDRSLCQGFVPPLHRLLGRNHGPSSEPHALPPRPLMHSLFRCAYWMVYSLLDQLRVHLTMARGGLVLYDRHVVDVLIDQKRYRYSGPMWPISLIWVLVPKPDLLVVLTAAPEMIQARKQEVPVEETARQLTAYAELAASLPYGHAVDASQPFDRVVDSVNDLILAFLHARIGARLGSLSTGPLANPEHRGDVVFAPHHKAG